MPISLSGSLNLSGSLTTTGTITATTLVVQTITSSISSITGSTNFGSLAANTHTFTGSILITGSNYISVGTPSPIYTTTLMSAYGSGSDVDIDVKNNTSAGAANLYLRSQTDGSGEIRFSRNSDNSIQGRIQFSQANGSMNFRTGGNDNKLFISSSGNVGIGTSSPSGQFQVQATNSGIVFDTATAYTPRIKAAGALSDLQIESVGNGGHLYLSAPGTTSIMTMSTNGGERMRITSAGNVGIGTTSTAYRLAVVTSGGAGLYISTSGSTFGNPSIAMINGAIDTTISATSDGLEISTYSSHNMYFRTATVERMRIYSDGYMSLNSVVFGTTTSGTVRTLYIGNGANYLIGGISSIRASKKNIKNISNVDWLQQLTPVIFNYRKKDEKGNYTEETYEDLNYGLIAEDTAPIADFLINYNDKEDGTKEMIGIEYPRLIVPLLKAIQELTARVQYLENK